VARYSRFYLGRVIKLGEMSSERLMRIVQSAPVIPIKGTRYTFTDFKLFGPVDNPNGIFARLAKYRPEGSVAVVRPEIHQVGTELVPDLLEASSEFVYLPAFSGIAYRHVWNVLQKETFERVFSELVSLSDQAFFARCEIQPIADLRTFVTRLARLDRITMLSASVNPPNPLFGPCWKSLFEYIKKRGLSELTIKEEGDKGIDTKIPEIAAAMADSGPAGHADSMMEPLLDGVGDAALLMAADGYGRAKVGGTEDGRLVTFKTSDNQKSFQMPVDVVPEELFREAFRYLEEISRDRYLEHK